MRAVFQGTSTLRAIAQSRAVRRLIAEMLLAIIIAASQSLSTTEDRLE